MGDARPVREFDEGVLGRFSVDSSVWGGSWVLGPGADGGGPDVRESRLRCGRVVPWDV